MGELEVMQPLAQMDGENGNRMEHDMDGEVEREEVAQEEAEEPMGIPFGWFGATLLTNILQYSLLLGISMVILIIIRVYMPASMLIP